MEYSDRPHNSLDSANYRRCKVFVSNLDRELMAFVLGEEPNGIHWTPYPPNLACAAQLRLHEVLSNLACAAQLRLHEVLFFNFSRVTTALILWRSLADLAQIKAPVNVIWVEEILPQRWRRSRPSEALQALGGPCSSAWSLAANR